jgi:hypothetical protein
LDALLKTAAMKEAYYFQSFSSKQIDAVGHRSSTFLLLFVEIPQAANFKRPILTNKKHLKHE